MVELRIVPLGLNITHGQYTQSVAPEWFDRQVSEISIIEIKPSSELVVTTSAFTWFAAWSIKFRMMESKTGGGLWSVF
jgi:hypothetical protein